jgi:hypothetical protein
MTPHTTPCCWSTRQRHPQPPAVPLRRSTLTTHAWVRGVEEARWLTRCGRGWRSRPQWASGASQAVSQLASAPLHAQCLRLLHRSRLSGCASAVVVGPASRMPEWLVCAALHGIVSLYRLRPEGSHSHKSQSQSQSQSVRALCKPECFVLHCMAFVVLCRS